MSIQKGDEATASPATVVGVDTSSATLLRTALINGEDLYVLDPVLSILNSSNFHKNRRKQVLKLLLTDKTLRHQEVRDLGRVSQPLSSKHFWGVQTGSPPRGGA